MPFRAETAHGYALGVLNLFSDLLAKESGGSPGAPVSIETRYRFNQAFKSAYAMVPSVVMLILMLTPAIMAAIGVAREKETGTIANFRSTPVTRLEFLTGKQLPYIAVAVLNFWTLYLMGRLLFGVPFTGNLFALFTVSVIYVIATTGLGQLVSSFTRTQVSAVFATAVITIIPTVNFSGLIVPVSSLTPSSQLLGKMFPGAWYQEVSVGSFVKAYGWSDMGWSAAMLCAFVVIYLALSVLALRKQER